MNSIGNDIVLFALRELADEDEQRRLWLADRGPEVGSLDEAISTLFDDSGLGRELDRGDVVYGASVDGLIKRLGQMSDAVDQDQSVEELLEDPQLESIRVLATAILSELDKSGQG